MTLLIRPPWDTEQRSWEFDKELWCPGFQGIPDDEQWDFNAKLEGTEYFHNDTIAGDLAGTELRVKAYQPSGLGDPSASLIVANDLAGVPMPTKGLDMFAGVRADVGLTGGWYLQSINPLIDFNYAWTIGWECVYHASNSASVTVSHDLPLSGGNYAQTMSHGGSPPREVCIGSILQWDNAQPCGIGSLALPGVHTMGLNANPPCLFRYVISCCPCEHTIRIFAASSNYNSGDFGSFVGWHQDELGVGSHNGQFPEISYEIDRWNFDRTFPQDGLGVHRDDLDVPSSVMDSDPASSVGVADDPPATCGGGDWNGHDRPFPAYYQTMDQSSTFRIGCSQFAELFLVRLRVKYGYMETINEARTFLSF